MNLKEVAPNTLVSQSSGLSALVAGVVFIVIGLAGVVTTLASKAGAVAVGFLALFLLIGIVLLFTAKKTTLTLMNPGTSTVTTKRLIGGGVRTQSFDASQVAGIMLTSRIIQSDGSNSSPMNPVRQTNLNLFLTDGSKVALAGTSSHRNNLVINGIGANQTLPFDADGQRIAALYGVQYVRRDSSFGDDPVQSIADASRIMRQAMDAAKAGAPYEQPLDPQDANPFAAPQQPAAAPPAAPGQPPFVNPGVAPGQPVAPVVPPQPAGYAQQPAVGNDTTDAEAPTHV